MTITKYSNRFLKASVLPPAFSPNSLHWFSQCCCQSALDAQTMFDCTTQSQC